MVTPGHLAFPNPLVLALVESSQGYFFPFFQNSHRGGSPCTTHPCGTANKPSGLMKKRKKKKIKRKVQHCAGFPFPSLSASSGSWEKSSRGGAVVPKGVGGRVREESLGCYVGVKSLWKGKGGGKYFTWIKQIKENVIWIRYSKADFCQVFLWINCVSPENHLFNRNLIRMFSGGIFFFSKEKKISLFSYHFRWKERKLQIFIAAKLLTVKPVLKQWIKFPQDHSGAVPFT